MLKGLQYSYNVHLHLQDRNTRETQHIKPVTNYPLEQHSWISLILLVNGLREQLLWEQRQVEKFSDDFEKFGELKSFWIWRCMD